MANVYIKGVSGGETTDPTGEEGLPLDDGSASTWIAIKNLIARKLRETSGPTTLAMGAVSDGQFLKRSTTSVVGAAVLDSDLSTSDITTNNASTSKHGFLPKIPNTYLQHLSPKTGAWVPKVVYKSANETVNNNGTPQNDDELLWAVLANEIWQFDMTLYYTGVNTTADILYGWDVPSGTTMLWGAIAGGTVTDTSFMNVPVANSPGLMLAAAGTQSAASNNGTVGLKLSGLVTVSSTAGNVTFKWSQNTAGLTNLVVLKGSNIILTQLA
jgi:hypothetical protein